MKLLPILSVLLLSSLSLKAQKYHLQKIDFYTPDTYYSTQYYSYSEGRGSDYKNGIINFDNIALGKDNSSQTIIRRRKYDSLNRVLDDLSTNGQGIGSSHKGTSYTYDTLGRVKKSTSYQGSYKSGNSHSDYTYIYDSLSRLLHLDVTYFPSHLLPPNGPYRSTFSYDTLNNITGEVYNMYDTTTKKYVYQRRDSFIYTYDTLNRITSQSKHSYHIGPTTHPEQWKKEYVYDSNNLVTKYTYYTYDKTAAKYTLEDVTTYQYNAAGYVTEKLVTPAYIPSHPKSINKIITTYNSYGQPDTIFDYRANSPNTIFNLFGYEHHVYGIYWPTNILEQQKTVEAKLYPSPATQFITIEANFKESQNLIATIMDIHGRILRKWTEKDVQDYKHTTSINNLPSGIYILKLSGEAEQVTKQFMVSK